MESKDQMIGAVILIVCIAIAAGYTYGVLFTPFRDWLIYIVVLLAFLAIMFIGAWIGWTMATTPPPKPIEELELEEEKAEEEAEEEKAEEKEEEK
ncbi:MAG: transcriptional regulator [Candidatus Bathyarchaeota archaeon]|nr:transcriptional regulator [Candidatus Bathyarchaeota archaeon]